MNCKQRQNQKLEVVIKLVGAYENELCRGDEICCGEIKAIREFSPSNLKCICKECAKKIRERNRQDKIDKDEDHYIYEKTRSTLSRVKFFYTWIKSQSKNAFNEHLDHVLPIHFFKKFSNASPYLTLRDSWINLLLRVQVVCLKCLIRGVL